MRDIVSPLSGFGSPFGQRRRGPSFLLDQFPGAAAAYSLRKLSADTTNAVRVRRSSDNTEADFTPAQIGDGSLLAWVGAGVSNNGLVTTWYDQSGNANHATQATAASQPKIVDAGALVTENGKVALSFDGSDDTLVTGNPVITTNTWFVELVGNYSGSGMILSQHGPGTGRLVFFEADPLRMFFNNGDSFAGVSGYSSISSSLFTSAAFNNDYYLATRGNALEKVIESQPLTPNRRLSIASGNQGNSFFGVLNANEILVYASDQSANRANIEANIADYYGITLA